MIQRINIVLLLVLGAILALLILLRVDNSRPNFQVILGDDMTYSPAYTSFEANNNFTSGRTLQDPVPGTIARGMQRFHFAATPQGAILAGEQLINPFKYATQEGAASAARGATTFSTFCTSCHGTDGMGNGPVAKRGFPPPPSLVTGKSREMKDGQLFHILTYGQNSMPQFVAQLPPKLRWDLINHIRRIQHDAPPVTAETPPTAVPPVGLAEPPVPETSPVTQPDPAQADEITKP